jgi:signal transduction histidine kinase
MLEKKKLTELCVPAFFLLLAGWILYNCSKMGGEEATFPRMVGVFILIVAAYEFFFDLKRKDIKPVFQNSNLLKVIETVLILFAYIFLLNHIGYIVDTIILSALIMYLLGYRNHKMMAVISIALTMVVFLMFKVLLRVPLPMLFFKS